MATQLTMEEITQARGRPVHSADGALVGEVEAIYFDKETDQPEWIGIGTGFIATKRVVVPLEGAELGENGIRVGYTKEQIASAPEVPGDEFDEATERALYQHYGLTWSEQPTQIAEPVDEEIAEMPTAAEEQALTRSEEELVVGKREVEAGSVRLRKWVETEPVQVDVELQRETVRVVREPIDQTVEAQIGEAEIEVPLRAEEAVVTKQTVAKERIALEKDTRQDVETISDEIRKERIDIEGDAIKEDDVG